MKHQLSIREGEEHGDSRGAPHGSPPAPLTKRQHAWVLLGVALGTAMEWYDYQLYSSLSNVISSQFFPKEDPVAQALSLWGVFALGFVTRPIGAIIFGHVGDRIGRKVSLLVSLLAMALPTVLVGCLPPYDVIGIAAPVLLSLLRVVQGLAIGGEYGTAVVYASELAPAGWEAMHGAIIVAFCQIGQLVGQLIVMLLVAVCTPAQLAQWGWRIPFLLVVFSASLALLLRLNMPEPLVLIARARLAIEAAEDAEASLGPGACDSTNAHAPAPAAGAGAKDVGKDPEDDGATARMAAAMRHRVPIGVLLRHNLLELVLFTFTAAAPTALVYTVSTWLPSYLRQNGMPNMDSQVMFLTALLFKMCCVLLTGWACDFGLPVCWTGALASALNASLPFALCAAIAAFIATSTLAAIWVLQLLLLGVAGVALALLPTVGTHIFPPSVRASGYNFGYSLASGFIGGLSPLAITAIMSSADAPLASTYGAAWWCLASATAAGLAYLTTLWRFPACNRAGATVLTSEQRRPTNADALGELRGVSMTRRTSATGFSLSAPLDARSVARLRSQLHSSDSRVAAGAAAAV